MVTKWLAFLRERISSIELGTVGCAGLADTSRAVRNDPYPVRFTKRIGQVPGGSKALAGLRVPADDGGPDLSRRFKYLEPARYRLQRSEWSGRFG